MTARDAMEFINEQDDATLERFIQRLEFRGRDPTFVGYRDAYLDAMDLAPGAHVLDLGCGTGVVTRALAGRVGRITGVDQSPVMIQAARRLAAEAGVADRIDFQVGDVHALDLPDGAFDAVVAHTLLSHVTDPAAVLAEIRRVLRPGGLLAVFDGDYASLTWSTTDPVLGGEMEAAVRRAIVSKPRVLRDLPRLLRATGLAQAGTQAHVFAEIGHGSFFVSLAETVAPLVARAGLQPPERVEAWLAEQREATQEGVFFAACSYYAYLARR